MYLLFSVRVAECETEVFIRFTVCVFRERLSICICAKIIPKSGQGWTLPAQLGQLKTGQDVKGLLRSRVWCPNVQERLWDRLD